LYAGAVAVTVGNAAVAADVAQLRAAPRASDVVRGRVPSLRVAMRGGGSLLEALTHLLDNHDALTEEESNKVKWESRAAGFVENCADALDTAESGQFLPKLLLLRDGRVGVGPESVAAVEGRHWRPAVVGIKLTALQGNMNYNDDQGRRVVPHACSVVDDDVLPMLSRASEAGALFSALDGSSLGALHAAKVDLVVVPNNFVIADSNTVRTKDKGKMKAGARYVWMTYVDALIDSRASFDDVDLRRHHAVYKPGQGDWDKIPRGKNAWQSSGPPATPYPPGFSRGALDATL
jgi:hypothetical protein